MSTHSEAPTFESPATLTAKLLGVVLISLTLVALAVLPQLTARLTGDELQLRVAPYDPIDPFRGAYVDLAYPDIQQVNTDGSLTDPFDGGDGANDGGGDVFVTIVEDGEVWKAESFSRTRPEVGVYLSCNDSDFRIRCGIESLFLPQGSAKALEDAVRDGTAIATVRVDSRGNAALMAVATPG
jgi:uncharacterized membrane-anchored protein